MVEETKHDDDVYSKWILVLQRYIPNLHHCIQYNMSQVHRSIFRFLKLGKEIESLGKRMGKRIRNTIMAIIL